MITPSRGRSRRAAGKRGRCRCRRRLFPRSPVRRSNQPIRRFAVGQLGEVRVSLTGWPDQGEVVGRVEKLLVATLRHRANTPSRARASTGRRRDRATSHGMGLLSLLRRLKKSGGEVRRRRRLLRALARLDLARRSAGERVFHRARLPRRVVVALGVHGIVPRASTRSMRSRASCVAISTGFGGDLVVLHGEPASRGPRGVVLETDPSVRLSSVQHRIPLAARRPRRMMNRRTPPQPTPPNAGPHPHPRPR